MTKFFLLFLSLFLVNLNAQTDSTYTDQTEIFVIDSYITPETPHKFIVSFSTSDSCTSIIQLKGMKTYVVSNSFTDNHKFEMDLSEIQYDSTAIKYRIYTKNREGLDTKGEEYEVELPREIVLSASNEINWYQMCIGGLVFAIPTLEYVQMNGGEHLGLSKEIPLYNFYSQGYNYPQGYIGIEYSHYVDAARKNFLRLGYKHMFQFEEIKYISPGLSFFGDFKGYNGLSVELSVGLFQIQNVFTVYTRYRYNFQLKSGGDDFNEFAVGLYANVFSFNF